MATLNENVAKVKKSFRNIKGHVNAKYGEYLENEERIESGTPVENYGGEISDVIDEIYSLGYDNGKLDVDDSGYDEGFEAGKQEILDNSKYIPKTATGKVISLNDVSEVSHKVKVYGDNQEVEVYGKNLFDGLLEKGGIDSITGTNYNADTTRTANYISITPNTLITITRAISGLIRTRFYDKDKNYLGHFFNGTYPPMTITTKENCYYMRLDLVNGNVDEKVQVELGGATAYEPYTHQTITATPTGTEIDSMCPNMSFFADEDITVDYYSSFGMNEEWNRFWDDYQNDGNRREYGNAFAGTGWNDTTFRPKYDIVVTSSSNLFLSSKITDIIKCLNTCGVTLDTSNCTTFSYSMQGMSSKTFPLLDLSASTSTTTNLFNNCQNLEYIVGIVSSEKTKFHNMSFGNCPKLTHCIFSGIIASDINLQWSKLLDDESLISISVALCDLVFSGFGDGWGSRTLTLSAESIARLKELTYPPDDLNPEGSSYAEDGASCYTVITTRKGWNVA